MKLILGNHPNAGRFETQHRENKIRKQLQREQRAEVRKRGVRRLFDQVRAIFVLLLLATILEFIFDHRNEIQRFTDAKIYPTVAKVEGSATSSSIGKGALTHQDEVNQVIGK